MENALASLLYISNSSLSRKDEQQEIDRIVAVARQRNAALEVTGALMFTGKHFAQVLEGSTTAIDELMSSICADDRHSGIDVIEIAAISERKFADWSMAYSGPSVYVDTHIKPLFKEVSDPSTRISAARSLIRLLEEFAAAGGVHRLAG